MYFLLATIFQQII